MTRVLGRFARTTLRDKRESLFATSCESDADCTDNRASFYFGSIQSLSSLLVSAYSVVQDDGKQKRARRGFVESRARPHTSLLWIESRTTTPEAETKSPKQTSRNCQGQKRRDGTSWSQ